MGRFFLAIALSACAVFAQEPCPSTPLYARCEIVFELNDAEQKAHPNPYLTVDIQAEFRSPRHRTVIMPAFPDGARRMVIRFAPIDVGDWEYRVTSNVSRFEGKQGTFAATESTHPGFIVPANGHHWRNTENRLAHLWMGDTMYQIGSIGDEAFHAIANARGAQKFTHLRGLVVGGTFDNPDQPKYDWYRRLDERVGYLNDHGIIFDMILGLDENFLAKEFPVAGQRARYLRYMIARYSAFNITWQLTQEFEEYENGRELLKEMGSYLKNNDPYRHPRTTHTVATSAPLLPDGWMDHVLYQSSSDELGAIEHQLFAVPFVNAEFAYENSGAGASHPHHVASDEFRHRLWNSFMNGQYPTYGNTGTYGGSKVPMDLKQLEAPGAKAMTVWFDFISTTRYWELEPYFDVDGGRAMALPETEYIIYVEKPEGPIEVRLEKHGYDVKWLNPITGETIPLKEFKSEKFVAEPPSRDHDWILHISREGRKQGMLRTYKFESRPFLMQDPESAVSHVPFKIAEPSGEEVSLAKMAKYSAVTTRETRGVRRMMYLWTGEVPVEGQGYRVIGTGPEGTWQLRSNMAKKMPAVMNVRLYGLNANGKLYFIDRIYRVTP